MRKIFFPAGRPAEVVVDAPVPVPGPGQLLVRTEAVGVGIGLVSRTRPGLVTERRAELWDLLAARLNPSSVDLPLGQITEAIDLVATRSNLGRVVLRTR